MIFNFTTWMHLHLENKNRLVLQYIQKNTLILRKCWKDDFQVRTWEFEIAQRLRMYDANRSKNLGRRAPLKKNQPFSQALYLSQGTFHYLLIQVKIEQKKNKSNK